MRHTDGTRSNASGVPISRLATPIVALTIVLMTAPKSTSERMSLTRCRSGRKLATRRSRKVPASASSVLPSVIPRTTPAGTPVSMFVSPLNAILLGGIAAIPSYLALQLRARTSLDDSLDVLAAHGVGGTVGALLTGVFAEKALNGVADGALYGNPRQLLIQGARAYAVLLDSGCRLDR